MTMNEKIEKVSKIINTNEEAKKFFIENASCIGKNWTAEQFYDVMISAFSKEG